MCEQQILTVSVNSFTDGEVSYRTFCENVLKFVCKLSVVKKNHALSTVFIATLTATGIAGISTQNA